MKRSSLLFMSLLVVTVVASRGQEQKLPGNPRGKLVWVGNHKMHLHCTGSSTSPVTVLFESGGGGYSEDWAKVRSNLAGVRTCAYDRAGSGWSEAGPSPRTMNQQVFELHTLLENDSIKGPFVLVGHSLGGLLVRLYAAQYGKDVEGVVLVDPTHESAVLANVRYGWYRVREKATTREIPKPVLEGEIKTKYNPNDDYMSEEFNQLYLSRQADPQPLGSRPLIVIGAGKRPQPGGTTAEQWKGQRQERDDQVRDLATLSGNSKFILDPSSGHAIHSENPVLIAKAIEEVLAAIQKKEKLKP